jgi:hypothetical protein
MGRPAVTLNEAMRAAEMARNTQNVGAPLYPNEDALIVVADEVTRLVSRLTEVADLLSKTSADLAILLND